VVAALRAGAVVGIPTHTVYGLAVDPSVPGSTDALFALKRRPEGLDLPVLVGTMEQFEDLMGPGPGSVVARRIARALWPGACTVVVTRRAGLDWALGARAGTIGLRCPAHDLARRLCTEVGPLATTSANLHGEPPCTEAAALLRLFDGELGAVLDGGPCDGAPSTVVDATTATPTCLRQGALAWTEVVAAAGAG
jgi:tRNA threonylcarbamoyl adenosine modification protein (Sua5/YciO/YrdC/YwlC family)